MPVKSRLRMEGDGGSEEGYDGLLQLVHTTMEITDRNILNFKKSSLSLCAEKRFMRTVE